MASSHLQLVDAQGVTTQKSVTLDTNIDGLDKSMNGFSSKTISGSDQLTEAEQRQNGFLELLDGTPGGAFNLDMFDTNSIIMTMENSTGQTATVRNSAGGGTTVTLLDNDVKMIFYDGTNVKTLS